MKRLSCYITIGSFAFTQVVNVNVQSSWDTLTDTSEISLPRKLKWQGEDIRNLIKRGMPVKVQLGYDDQLESVFEGYVTKIHSSVPMKIECQDEMWQLKQTTVTKSYPNVDLKTLIQDTTSLNTFEAPDLGLGPFRLSEITPAAMLEYIKETYYQKAFFRDGTLYVGLSHFYKLYDPQVKIFDMQHNVVSHDLTYEIAEDQKIKLKAVIINEGNERIELEYGDPDGEQRTLYYYNVSQADVEAVASEEIQRMKYDGYKGSLTAFGEPFVQHGDIIEIRDATYPERTGRYRVKSVEYNFGQDGYRQNIELHERN